MGLSPYLGSMPLVVSSLIGGSAFVPSAGAFASGDAFVVGGGFNPLIDGVRPPLIRPIDRWGMWCQGMTSGVGPPSGLAGAGAPAGAGGADGSDGIGGDGDFGIDLADIGRKPSAGSIERVPMPGGWTLFVQSHYFALDAVGEVTIARHRDGRELKLIKVEREDFKGRKGIELPDTEALRGISYPDLREYPVKIVLGEEDVGAALIHISISPSGGRVMLDVEASDLDVQKLGEYEEGAERDSALRDLISAPFMKWLSHQAAAGLAGRVMFLTLRRGDLPRYLLLDNYVQFMRRESPRERSNLKLITDEGKERDVRVGMIVSDLKDDFPPEYRRCGATEFQAHEGQIIFAPHGYEPPDMFYSYFSKLRASSRNVRHWIYSLPDQDLSKVVSGFLDERLAYARSRNDSLLVEYMEKVILLIEKLLASVTNRMGAGRNGPKDAASVDYRAGTSQGQMGELARAYLAVAGGGSLADMSYAGEYRELCEVEERLRNSVAGELIRIERASIANREPVRPPQLDYLFRRFGPGIKGAFERSGDGGIDLKMYFENPATYKSEERRYQVGFKYLLHALPVGLAGSLYHVLHHVYVLQKRIYLESSVSQFSKIVGERALDRARRGVGAAVEGIAKAFDAASRRYSGITKTSPGTSDPGQIVLARIGELVGRVEATGDLIQRHELAMQLGVHLRINQRAKGRTPFLSRALWSYIEVSDDIGALWDGLLKFLEIGELPTEEDLLQGGYFFKDETLPRLGQAEDKLAEIKRGIDAARASERDAERAAQVAVERERAAADAARRAEEVRRAREAEESRREEEARLVAAHMERTRAEEALRREQEARDRDVRIAEMISDDAIVLAAELTRRLEELADERDDVSILEALGSSGKGTIEIDEGRAVANPTWTLERIDVANSDLKAAIAGPLGETDATSPLVGAMRKLRDDMRPALREVRLLLGDQGAYQFAAVGEGEPAGARGLQHDEALGPDERLRPADILGIIRSTRRGQRAGLPPWIASAHEKLESLASVQINTLEREIEHELADPGEFLESLEVFFDVWTQSYGHVLNAGSVRRDDFIQDAALIGYMMRHGLIGEIDKKDFVREIVGSMHEFCSENGDRFKGAHLMRMMLRMLFPGTIHLAAFPAEFSVYMIGQLCKSRGVEGVNALLAKPFEPRPTAYVDRAGRKRDLVDFRTLRLPGGMSEWRVSEQEAWFRDQLAGLDEGRLSRAAQRFADETGRHPERYNGKREVHVGVRIDGVMNTREIDPELLRRVFDSAMGEMEGRIDKGTLYIFHGRPPRKSMGEVDALTPTDMNPVRRYEWLRKAQ